jgi:hypothetical protein
MGFGAYLVGVAFWVFVSPLGWVISTLIGLAVLYRVGALRRRP